MYEKQIFLFQEAFATLSGDFLYVFLASVKVLLLMREFYFDNLGPGNPLSKKNGILEIVCPSVCV